MENKLKIGDRVFVEQAWEDEAGHYHDEYATVLDIDKHVKGDGLLTLKWDRKKLDKFLKTAEYHAQDVEEFSPGLFRMGYMTN